MKQNILFILIDCLRADVCVDPNRNVKTPSLDFLRLKGTFFSNLIAASTSTSPSVATILTGTYPFEHGLLSLSGYSLKEEMITLPQYLKKRGYHTYAEVTGPLSPELKLTKGFDEYNFRNIEENVYSLWGENFIKRLISNYYKDPWFLFLHIWVLHSPRKLMSFYKKRSFGKNKYERALSSLDAFIKRLFNYIDLSKTFIILTGDHGEELFQSDFEKYLNILLRILNKRFELFKIPIKFNIKETGHGWHVYDRLIKVPLYLFNPDAFPSNLLIETPVRQIDILPTILDVINTEYLDLDQLKGISLKKIIRNPSEEMPPAYTVATLQFKVDGTPDPTKWLESIRTKKYKFIHAPYNIQIREELYDLENDPYEKKNLIKKFPLKALEMKDKLICLKQKHMNDIMDLDLVLSKEDEKKVIERLKRLGYIE